MKRKDLILLDDKQEIMVFPHRPHNPKWFTYDELDKLRRTLSPRLPRMIFEYNEMVSWIKRHRRRLTGGMGKRLFSNEQ